MFKYNFLLLCLICLFSCKKKLPDIGEVKVVRFDQELFTTPIDDLSSKIPQWQAYGDFFNYYNQEVIHLGDSKAPDYINNLKLFLGSEVVKLSYTKAQEVFKDNTLQSELTKAFQYVKYYFPEKSIPIIYTYVAGFNQSLMLGDNFIGIGLDKYLGTDCETYKMLGIYKYMIRNMYKEKIPSDCIFAYALGEWPYQDNESTVLAKMIYEGMLLYFTRQILPEASESQIFGFSDKQLDWCKMNEGEMWAHLVNDKLLYSTDNFTKVKLTEDAPYTSIFPSESPGKACNWVGYKIVERYMKENDKVSLSELMNTKSYQAIFEKSKYKPKR